MAGRNEGSIVVGYATGTVSGAWQIGSLVGENHGMLTGHWNRGATSVGGIGTGIFGGIGTSSTDNIYYYTAASEDPGREQNKYYDKGTGTDPSKGIQETTRYSTMEILHHFLNFPKKTGDGQSLRRALLLMARLLL